MIGPAVCRTGALTQSIALEPGEAILFEIRRHGIVLWPRFVILLLVSGLPAGFAVGVLARSGVAQRGAWRAVAAAAAVWAGFWLLRAVILKYRHDRERWVVTDTRLIGIHAPAPFRSSLSFLDLAEIQGIAVHRQGPVALLFGYGDLACQAGTAPPVVLRQAPRAQQLAVQLQLAVRNARRVRRPRSGDASATLRL
jgi:hypothetical protein